MDRREITLHGGPLDGEQIAEPQSYSIIYPLPARSSLRYYADDEPISAAGWVQVRYQQFAYRNPVNGLTHIRWEYEPSGCAEEARAVAEYLEVKRQQQAAEEYLEVKRQQQAAEEWYRNRTAFETFRGFSAALKPEWEIKMPAPPSRILSILDDVIAHKQQADEPVLR